MNLNVVTPLVEAIHAARPHLTVLSGDFVQNGWRGEFEQAREFVRRLPQPWLAVPGNHDMPFVNALRRITTGLRLYQEYITPELEPFWTDDEIAVLGITTARRLQFRGGRIGQDQIRRVQRRLCSVDPWLTRILVSHHPFDLHESYHRRELVGRARVAMGQFAQSVDVLLAGHMHISHAGHTAVRYNIQGKSAIFVQAGTATSTRGRGEPNAFNRIVIERPRLVVERHQYDNGLFRCVCTDKFHLDPEPACETAPSPVHPKDVQIGYPHEGA